MENSQFSSTYFSVIYYPSNHSIYYQIDGSSLITGKVTASFSIIVYGLNVYQSDINLCNFNVKTICPLTAGHLDISGTYQIDEDQIPSIPSIAYGVPDLDAYVQVHVYDIEADGSTNKTMLACLQATLENGKTVQTRYAAWPIAVISGFGLVVSSIVSLFGHSATASHIASNACSLFIYFQSLAVMAMMGVAKVPPIAAAWAQNFMWTLGIIRVEFMQQMLYWYIQATGGQVTSVLANESVISISVQKKLKQFARSLLKRAVTVESGSTTDVLEDPAMYTTDESHVSAKILVLRGIQRVAFLARIEISNIFMTSIIFFLFVGFVLIVSISLFKGFLELFIRMGVVSKQRLPAFREHWRSIVKGLLYRLINITFSQLTLMCIWEFTVHNSGGCVVFAVVLALVAWVLMCYATVRIFLAGRSSLAEHGNPAYLLFGDTKFLNRFGFLYTQYKANKYYWTPISLIYLFIKALLIAVLQTHGKICACMVFALEIIYMVAVIWKRPFMDKRTNVFNIFIAIVNFINSIFFLFYSNVFKQPQVVSSVAALVYFILNAVFALILLIMTIITCTLALVHRNPDSRYEPFRDDRAAFIPKGDERKSKAEYELEELGAAAMRGHNRSSMLPESGELDGKAVAPNNNSSTFNPFDADDEPIYPANKGSSTSNSNSKSDSYDSGLQFTNQGYGNSGYGGNTAYTGYSNSQARTRANQTSNNNNNSNEAFYGKNTFRQRSII
ncbi:DEKNAAC102069 [Brettanomyces naardenensis]|uniref:DEKNAAC102069 n=1 Tax=Brettanomyces naardenensis TaxID=13370 RepID=A0A448YJV7_BRENA|nr:DEKNAAC102069 [Brettanomyces naardenensis]